MNRVYFLRRRDGEGPVKIGCSCTPDLRLRTFAEWSPYMLEIAAIAAGDFPDESALHRRFAAHRLHGEWFAPSPELSALIEEVARTGELPEWAADDRTRTMVERYEGGETLKAIGDDYGLTRERVRQILRKAGCVSLGLRPEHRRRCVSRAAMREEEILRLDDEGKSLAAIAEAVGDYIWNVRNALRRAGRTAPRKAGRPLREDVAERHAAMARLYQQGERVAVIAEKFGCVLPDVYRALHRFGVKPCRHRRLAA